jgi:MFS family permease
MGRNNLGQDRVSDELNLLEPGKNYGWPYCYDDGVPNPEFNDPARYASATPPAFKFPPHWAPLGFVFYTGPNAPPSYRGDALTTFFDVKQTGWYLAVFALSNFLGALLLSPLFDSIGRVKMITGTYVLSGVLLGVAGLALGSLNAVTLTVFGAVIFFFASAAASAAYLTASEVFPLETRALCIAFFYAIGTAAGGISGPLLFGALIGSASEAKDITGLAVGYFLGAALMVVGGLAEAFLGVKAEGQSLESIAQPLTAEEAGTADAAPSPSAV